MPELSGGDVNNSRAQTLYLKKSVSDQAIDLLMAGLDGIELCDHFDRNADDFINDEFLQHLQSEFYMWYSIKTVQEKKWLNTNNDARQMVHLAMSGFDNLMKINGISG